MLLVRLQQMMQAHCDEAIKLLNSSANMHSPGLSGTQQVFQINKITFNNSKCTSSPANIHVVLRNYLYP